MRILAGALAGAAMAMFSVMVGANINTAFMVWAIIIAGCCAGQEW